MTAGRNGDGRVSSRPTASNTTFAAVVYAEGATGRRRGRRQSRPVDLAAERQLRVEAIELAEQALLSGAWAPSTGLFDALDALVCRVALFDLAITVQGAST